jgi:hypothetical protein
MPPEIANAYRSSEAAFSTSFFAGTYKFTPAPEIPPSSRSAKSSATAATAQKASASLREVMRGHSGGSLTGRGKAEVARRKAEVSRSQEKELPPALPHLTFPLPDPGPKKIPKRWIGSSLWGVPLAVSFDLETSAETQFDLVRYLPCYSSSYRRGTFLLLILSDTAR